MTPRVRGLQSLNSLFLQSRSSSSSLSLFCCNYKCNYNYIISYYVITILCSSDQPRRTFLRANLHRGREYRPNAALYYTAKEENYIRLCKRFVPNDHSPIQSSFAHVLRGTKSSGEP